MKKIVLCFRLNSKYNIIFYKLFPVYIYIFTSLFKIYPDFILDLTLAEAFLVLLIIQLLVITLLHTYQINFCCDRCETDEQSHAGKQPIKELIVELHHTTCVFYPKRNAKNSVMECLTVK